jgi:hypothetical protein
MIFIVHGWAWSSSDEEEFVEEYEADTPEQASEAFIRQLAGYNDIDPEVALKDEDPDTQPIRVNRIFGPFQRA